MPDQRVTVVVSQGQSRAPDKRQLESAIAEGAASLPGVEVLVVPHLYDLSRTGQSYDRLRAIDGPIVFCAWLFDRATHWVLDRNGVRGQFGSTQMKPAEESEEEEENPIPQVDADSQRVTDAYPRPDRHIFCLDLRDSARAEDFLNEIRRIVATVSDATALPVMQLASGTERVVAASVSAAEPTLLGLGGITTIDEHPTRRWYPVIDFSRCTNCMECIDFCLFGVYGVDNVETILVEQPDNCRKGCPACSRVCPQNAIIFPQHKTPAIAGAPMDSSGFKIDLSKLFGAPDEGADAIEVAARERDEQLILAGRQAVGLTEDLQSRLSKNADAPKDDLDRLIDSWMNWSCSPIGRDALRVLRGQRYAFDASLRSWCR